MPRKLNELQLLPFRLSSKIGARNRLIHGILRGSCKFPRFFDSKGFTHHYLQITTYFSTVVWERNDQVFTDNQYSRGHVWKFDGGAQVKASASPHIVPLPYSVEENVDPEEAFVASLSSCHMLFFLSIAAKKSS